MQFWNTGAPSGGAHGLSARIPGLRRPPETRRSSAATRPGSRYIPFGEVLPYATTASPWTRRGNDRYGVPLIRIDYPHRRERTEDDRTHVRHRRGTGEGGRYRSSTTSAVARRNGSAIHEHGTCRMGDDPKRSALNAFNQMHEVKNLFVVDGSSFPDRDREEPDADDPRLSWRATDYIVEQMKRGDL
jgi:choline dehydrogenase-like flavoprotein